MRRMILMRLIKNIFKGIIKFLDKHIVLPITKFFVFIGEKLKIADKPLEMALTKKSSMIIVSLILALVVFFIVDQKSTTLLETNAEVIYNRPVKATYNDEEYVIEGLPDTVDITLIGTKANLYLAKQLPTQDVIVDLSDLKPGVHKVNLKYKQSISSVEYKLDPSVATVVISSKKSETREIESDIVNLSKLDSKLAISNVDLDVDEIIIKGSEENLAKVSKIKALVNVSDMIDPKAGTNTLKNVPLVAYDENGKVMDIEMVPSTVNATVEIESPSKEVPLKVVTSGDVVFGKAIKDITTSVDKVTIYGDSATLEKTNSIEVKVDVSDLKTNKQYTKTIKKPSGIRDISVKTVNINIELDDEVTTELSGVRLGYINLDSNYTVQATEESSTEVTVILKGVESVIKDITSTQVEAYVDLKGLGVGEHEVEIKVKGNDSKVLYSSKVKKTTIKIAEK
jgi:YbbR domain-containing protein